MRLSDNKSQLLVCSDNQAYALSTRASDTDVNCRENPSYAKTGEVQERLYTECVVNATSTDEYDYIDQDALRHHSRQIERDDHTYY